PRDKPFFIAYGTFNPHMPWYVPQKYFDLFPLDTVEPAPINMDDLDDIPPLGLENAKRRDWVKQLIEIDEYKKGVQAYLATTAYADAQVGRVLEALDQSPHRDNTIVIMVSDHGFHLGEKLNWQKNTLWEEATHSLLTIRVPGMTKPGSVSERFVSLQDIYPTLAELCGLAPPEPIDGRSLTPLLKDPAAAWQSTAITAHEDRHITIRTETYRYIRYNDEQEEFYDCAKDPNEWTNQIDNPAYAEAIADLRKKLPRLDEMAMRLPRPERKNRKK
ncbi:MAG: sulfatase-like hydrolase/transferase, partial [Phycisphaeraceae bacterium]